VRLGFGLLALIAALAIAVHLALGAPPAWRLALLAAYWLATLGVLQASSHT